MVANPPTKLSISGGMREWNGKSKKILNSLGPCMAFNTWRAKVNHNIQLEYTSCDSLMLKSTMHRFWQCLNAKKTWELTFSFLCSLKLPTNSTGIWKTLNVEQCLFNKRLPNSLRMFSFIWTLLWDVFLCSIWIEMNIIVCNNNRWWDVKLGKVIGEGFFYYGCIEWLHTLQ
jgi:hypothetical protein